MLNVELNNDLINLDLCSDTLNNSKPLIDYGIFQYVHLDIEYNQNQLFSLNDEYKYFNLLINKKFIDNSPCFYYNIIFNLYCSIQIKIFL